MIEHAREGSTSTSSCGARSRRQAPTGTASNMHSHQQAPQAHLPEHNAKAAVQSGWGGVGQQRQPWKVHAGCERRLLSGPHPIGR